jgi:hypothetical protein
MTRSLHRRSAFTIVELLIAATLFTALLGISYTLLLSGGRQQKFVSQHADLADKTRRAVRRMSKDIRAARKIIELRRQGTGLRTFRMEVPDPEDPDGLPLRVTYRFERARHLLTRNNRPLLSNVLREVDLYAFDEVGRLLDDKVATLRLSYLRLHLEFSGEDAAPGRQRKLDLTLSPRVPASKVKAERVLLERSLDRFNSRRTEHGRTDGTGTGRGTGRGTGNGRRR